MSQLYIFAFISALTIASPGPGVMLTITNTMNYNLKFSVIGILGLAVGVGIVSILASSSLSLILTSSLLILVVIKLFGAGYLLFLSFCLFRKTSPKLVASEACVSNVFIPSKAYRFKQGVLVSISNPKTIVFFMALFPQFITSERSAISQSTILTLIFCSIFIIIHLIYGFSAQTLKRKVIGDNFFPIINKSAACVFVMFSIGLMVSAVKSII